MPTPEATRLVALLRPYTITAERGYFAVWEGFGVTELQAFTEYPRIRVPHRAYFLFQGPIDAAPFVTFGNFQQTPNLWWPEDRAWCVATEIDLSETYIGGSRECIGAVLSDPSLEAFATTPFARADIGGDEINL